MRSRGVVAVALLLCAVNAFAQSPVPAAGIAAEAAGEWAQALDVYKSIVDREPRNAALWVRVADIEARLGNIEGSVSALQHAVAGTPRDAALLHRLSQAYAVLDRPMAALETVERALVLSPESLELLRARATLATWLADYDRAQQSYRHLRKLQPEDHDLSLNLARVSAWGGHTDAAVEAYEHYLQAEPGAAAVWIELARTEAWRGNFGSALEILEKYRVRFGNDDAYAREMAAVLARAGRPGKALDTIEPMLRQHPDDYELNLTRTIALTMQRRPREASDALDTVRRLQPNGRDTRAAERVVRTALASTIDPGVSVYSDSSSLEVQRVAPRATVALAHGTTLSVGSEHERLSARPGSGLEQLGANPNAQHDHLWMSAAQRAGVVNLRGQVGHARAAGGDLTTYAIGADFTPVDGVKLSVERSSDFFVVSPRTVGLGLQQVGHRAQLEWSPDMRSHIAADVLYQTLSDGNQRWEFTLSPRRGVARTERLKLDLGFVVTQLRTTTNFDHGYYDPRRYEYYAASAYPYFKIRESIGVGLSLALGAQRDDFSPRFRVGGNATAEATFGIYSTWALKITGGETINQRLTTGAFRGFGASASIVKRF
jgi:tetratricopeptide (TPR) repeat protein